MLEMLVAALVMGFIGIVVLGHVMLFKAMLTRDPQSGTRGPAASPKIEPQFG